MVLNLEREERSVSLRLTLEARGSDYVQEIEEALTGTGFAVRRARPQDVAKDITAELRAIFPMPSC